MTTPPESFRLESSNDLGPRFPAYLLAIVVTTETILGGSGHAISIGPMSLRLLLFGVFLSAFLVPCLTLPNSQQRLAWILTSTTLLWTAVFAGVAYLNGASSASIVESGNVYVTLTYAVLFAHVFSQDRQKIISIFRLIEWCGVIIAIVTLAAVAAAAVGILDLRRLDAGLHALGYGGHTGGVVGRTPRVYFISQIYLQIAIALAYARLIRSPRTTPLSPYVTALELLILGSALVVTFTRGFWIGAVVSVTLITLSAGVRQTLRRMLLVVAIISSVIVLSMRFGPYKPGNLAKRVASSVDFAHDKGNLVRGLQIVEVSRQLRGHLTLGMGFGTRLPSSYYRIRRRITGEQMTGKEFVIELSYLDLLRQVGIVGFTIFSSATLALLFALRRASRAPLSDSRQDSSFVSIDAFRAGIVGFLITALTNPYLLSSAGFFLFSMAIALVSARPKASSREILMADDDSTGQTG